MKLTNISRTVAKPTILDIKEFRGGYSSLIDEARMPSKFAVQSTNMIQDQDGIWSTRWGMDYYGPAITGETSIDGAAEFIKTDLTKEIIAVGGTTGKIWKSVDKGAWEQVGSATLTPGTNPDFLQVRSQLYITNGVDPLMRYDGTNLLIYTAIDPISDLSFARTVLTTGSFHYWYMVTALNAVGETVGSNEIDVTVNKERVNWGDTEYVTLSWSKVTGATSYRVYAHEQQGFESYLADVVATADATITYKDDGSAIWNPFLPIHDGDTTAAPKFGTLEISNNRLWGTNDPDNRWRVYWGSASSNTWGSWSDFDGGGSVDLELGGRETPVKVVHYRTGAGVSIATVLCSSPEGTGSIWQITLTSTTVNGVTFDLPFVQKITGSIGSNAPFSVVKARDNIGFCNKKGFFFLRSKPQMLNLLSTDETSQPIRPDYRSLNQSQIQNLCSYYYEGKVFFSGAEGTSNDIIFIYDMEYNNWNYKWTKGVKRFFEHTENTAGDATTHFLGVPITGNRLIEINQNFEGDFGQPFYQSYLSPLIPVSNDKSNVLKTKESIIELGRPKGRINFEILGIEAKKGFSSLATRSITSNTSYTSGMSTDMYSDFKFSDTNGVPTTFSQSSLKKGKKIRKQVYSIQYRVYSNSANTKYSILSIQTKGRLLNKQSPSSWFQ